MLGNTAPSSILRTGLLCANADAILVFSDGFLLLSPALNEWSSFSIIRSPFEVFNRVVQFVSVDVIHFELVIGIRDKRDSNKSAYPHRFFFPCSTKRDRKISILVFRRLQYLSATSSLWQAENQPGIRHLIKPFVFWDISPLNHLPTSFHISPFAYGAGRTS